MEVLFVYRVLMLEVYGTFDQIMAYYGTPEQPGGHLPFNFLFISNLGMESSAFDFNGTINDYMGRMTDGRWPNWVVSPVIVTPFIT